MMKHQKGMMTIEYILLVIVIVTGWNFIGIVKDAISSHQDSYVWSISRYDR